MAEPLAQALRTDMSVTPQSRIRTAEGELATTRQEIEQLTGEKGAFEAETQADLATRGATRARTKAGALRAEREAIEKSPERQALMQTEEQLGKAAFVPTQENALSLAAMFSLINIVGFAIGAGGKKNAQAAMSAMNGMAEGYQKGQRDFYAKERQVFDTNLRALKTRSDILGRRLQEIAKLAQTDRQAADQEADAVFAEQGADFLKKYKDKFGLAAAIELQKNKAKDTQKIIDEARKELDRERRDQERARVQKELQDQRLAEQARLQQQRIEAQAQRQATRGGGASGTGGAVQFRYNAAMTNAGNQLAIEIENAASLPLSATPPAAAEVLTNPAKGLTDATRAFFAQRITSEEARAMQQTLAGMQRAITTIESSGRPSGATEGAIREFGKTMPRAGDNRINTYLFLAQAKQVMEILVKDLKASGGTPEQIAQAEAARDRVNSTITWNVKNINDILAKGGRRLVDPQVQQSIDTSTNLREFERGVRGGGQAGQASPAAQGRPIVRTQAEFDALPPGTEYQEESGKIFRKPQRTQ